MMPKLLTLIILVGRLEQRRRAAARHGDPLSLRTPDP